MEVARPGQRRQLAPEPALLGQQLRLTSDPARPLAPRHQDTCRHSTGKTMKHIGSQPVIPMVGDVVSVVESCVVVVVDDICNVVASVFDEVAEVGCGVVDTFDVCSNVVVVSVESGVDVAVGSAVVEVLDEVNSAECISRNNLC